MNTPAPSGADGHSRPRLKSLLPSRNDYRDLDRSWPRDLLAGLTVGVVALPLALAFGIASGVGAGPGLVTAVVAGAIAALFGGSHVQVSGPTGAMTVVLVPLVHSHGPAVVYPVAIVAGVMLVAAGVVGAGRLLAYVPWPLIEGFTVGIAVIIAAQQVPAALGVTKPDADNAAWAAVLSVGRAFTQHQLATFGVFALAALTMLVVSRVHRVLPAGLLAVIVATVFAATTRIHVARIGHLPAGLPTPQVPPFGGLSGIVSAGLVVAFLGALESALSATVADGMSDAPRHDTNRELLGQGLANIASGLCGGVPATGAIARTAVNVRAGARTRLAAFTHAVALTAVIYLAAGLIGRVPLAALAGVLIVTAARMVNLRTVRVLLRTTRADAAIFLITAACTVSWDLVHAVAAGLVIAVVTTLARVSRNSGARPEALTPAELGPTQDLQLLQQHILVYRLDGPLHFAVTTRFLTEMLSVADVSVVILRTSGLGLLDASGAKALGEIIAELRSRGITVLVKGLSADQARVLEAVDALRGVREHGLLFDNLGDAVNYARGLIAGARTSG